MTLIYNYDAYNYDDNDDNNNNNNNNNNCVE